MNVLILRGGMSYRSMFQRNGWNTIHGMGGIPEGNKIDLICFTGGTDVNPKLYNHKRHRFTSSSDVSRDEIEQEVYRKARERGIPMVGICRGAQFLCVMNKGSLYQHVTNHSAPHSMVTKDGERFGVSSTHHQMMNPSSTGEVVGWAEGLSSVYEIGDERQIGSPFRGHEPEAVLWKDTKCFATQYHPEYFMKNVKAVDFFFDYVNRIIKK